MHSFIINYSSLIFAKLCKNLADGYKGRKWDCIRPPIIINNSNINHESDYWCIMEITTWLSMQLCGYISGHSSWGRLERQVQTKEVGGWWKVGECISAWMLESAYIYKTRLLVFLLNLMDVKACGEKDKLTVKSEPLNSPLFNPRPPNTFQMVSDSAYWWYKTLCFIINSQKKKNVCRSVQGKNMKA